MILGQEMPGQAGHDGRTQAGHDEGAIVMADPDRPSVDFSMEFYNPDGSGGMMCGNGGRCIVAFADYLGIRPAECERSAEGVTAAPGVFLFRAPDGLHTGEILDRPSEDLWTVRIKMIDVQGVTPMLGGYFLNTGTRHFVKIVEDVEQVDVDAEGKALRWNEAFAPIGTNVNFVHVACRVCGGSAPECPPFCPHRRRPSPPRLAVGGLHARSGRKVHRRVPHRARPAGSHRWRLNR